MLPATMAALANRFGMSNLLVAAENAPLAIACAARASLSLSKRRPLRRRCTSFAPKLAVKARGRCWRVATANARATLWTSTPPCLSRIGQRATAGWL